MGMAEEKKPEYRCESELSRAWEDAELGVYVVPEILPALVESSLGPLKLGLSTLRRDKDGEGSVCVRGRAVDGRLGVVVLIGVVLFE